MKKNNLIFVALIIMFTNCNSRASQEKEGLKRYNIKSGKITYRTITNGKVMGSTTTGKGTASCIFKDWGTIELREEKETTTTVVKIPFGGTQKDVQTSHTMNKLVLGKSYSVDFEAEKIYETDDMAMNLIKGLHPNQNAEEVGRKGMEAIGGEKTGTGKILDYECEVWEAMGVKQWIYKGVTLKTEANTAGIHIVQEAISANFNIKISDDELKLPDFPIGKQPGFMGGEGLGEDMEEGDMMQEMQKMKKMSFKEWKKAARTNDPEMREMSDKELRQIYDMMKNMPVGK